ncbi:MAG: hypothetical protein HEP71_09265 [Roseivirga sp.]|nr:hypothetical protein [Roseivirga sp.]
MVITDYLNDSDDRILIDNLSYEYVELFRDSGTNFRYGYCLIGWVVFDDENNHALIKWNGLNFLGFLRILELNSIEVFTSISDRVKQLANEKMEFLDFFPIVGIVKTCFSMQSNYWSELCLNFLLKNKLYQKQLTFLREYKNCSWCNQKVNHMIWTYLSRMN